MLDLNAGGSLTANTGSCPVGGRPRFFCITDIDLLPIIFRITDIDFLAFNAYYVKGEPVESGNFPPALTQRHGGNPWPRLSM